MKVLIVKEAYNGKEVGTIESIIEDNAPILKKENQHRFFKNLQIINLPNNLVGKPINVIEIEPRNAFWSKEGESDVTVEPRIAEHWVKDGVTVWISPMLDEYWSKEGESDVTVDPEDETWTYHASVVDPSYSYVQSQFDNSWSYSPAILEGEFGIELDVEKDKIQRIKNAKDALEADLYLKMAEAYGTANPVSATSNYLTWLSMKNSPAVFANANLKSRFNIDSVVAGDTLNTEEEILEYANGLLTASDIYAMYREQKIQEFIVEKMAIEAE